MNIPTVKLCLSLLWPLSHQPPKPKGRTTSAHLQSGKLLPRALPMGTMPGQILPQPSKHSGTAPHPAARHVHRAHEWGRSALCWDRSIGCLGRCVSIPPTLPHPCPGRAPVWTQDWLPRAGARQLLSHEGTLLSPALGSFCLHDARASEFVGLSLGTPSLFGMPQG